MIQEILPPNTARAHPAMSALRPAWSDEAAFVERIDTVQRPAGYRIVGIFEPEEAAALAVAGFRTGHNLPLGHHLYVDDLSTLPTARRRGYARQLLRWLVVEARRLGCEELHLDSGVGPSRQAAHRLYLNSGYVISAHHFSKCL